ncbi:MAG: ABC transporter ATP-binding protein [Chromatocurvus sp.]
MIRAQSLSKGFRLYRHPSDRLKEALLRRSFHTRHQALDAVSFTLQAGETLGIIGRNGAGKSTLLKILNGVLLPDSGTLHSSGRVTGLLELGTGFDSDMSGQHNILTNGLLLGMTETEIEARRERIIGFAELGRFIDEPLRTYSSGMTMRLAFAIAIHADPDTFLIDEALSVGDASFQQKCMRRIREFRAAGGGIIFVSHDMNAMKMICDRALVLENGRIVAEDSPESAVNLYNRLLAGDLDPADAANNATKVEDSGYGNGKARITGANGLGADSQATSLSSGEDYILDIDVQANAVLPNLTVGLMIRDRFGQDLFGTNTHLMGHRIPVQAGASQQLRLRIPMHLAPGRYTLTLALHEGADHTRECYCWWDNAVQFEVSGIRGSPFVGLCNLQPRLEHRD